MYLYDIVYDKFKHPKLYRKEKIDKKNCDVIDVIALLKNKYQLGNFYNERMFVAAFDANKKCKGLYEIAKGNQNHCILFFRLLITFLVLIDANSFAIFHNHPNELCYESEDDTALYFSTQKKMEPFEFELIGSYILTKDEWKKVNEDEVYDYEEM